MGDLDLAFEESTATERIRVNAVSANFFSALGIQAYLGRVLTPEDEKARAMYAVVSYEFWRWRLAGTPSILGRNLGLNGRAFTVVGVLPKGVHGLTVDTSPAIRIPFAAGSLLVQKPDMDGASSAQQFQIFGHLRPGVALPQAEAELESLVLRAFPRPAKSGKDVFDSRFRLEPVPNGVSSLRVQFSWFWLCY